MILLLLALTVVGVADGTAVGAVDVISADVVAAVDVVVARSAKNIWLQFHYETNPGRKNSIIISDLLLEQSIIIVH